MLTNKTVVKNKETSDNKKPIQLFVPLSLKFYCKTNTHKKHRAPPFLSFFEFRLDAKLFLDQGGSYHNMQWGGQSRNWPSFRRSKLRMYILYTHSLSGSWGTSTYSICGSLWCMERRKLSYISQPDCRLFQLGQLALSLSIIFALLACSQTSHWQGRP